MAIPKTIFKYQAMNINNIVNLKNRTIYFSSPKHFNDPYDCAINAPIKDLNDEELEDFRRRAVEFSQDGSIEGIETILRTDLLSLGKMANTLASIALKGHVKRVLNKYGVSCFSSDNENLLMWSHYADGGRGYCLEFDTGNEIFSKLKKVEYSDDIPAIDPRDIVESTDKYFRLSCLKSKAWDYENEWRIFYLEAGTKVKYEKSALKAVYFGPEMSFDRVELVALIAKSHNPKIKLYQGKRCPDKFCVEFPEVFDPGDFSWLAE